MTDQNMEHPTSGRRRRHKSPPSAQYLSALPVPRLADHLDTEHGPSDEEGGKEAKRQKSEQASGSILEGQPLLKDEPQTRKENVKSEVATPKLEPTVKEELDEQDADGQDADTLREELPNREEISPPDSEDSLGPEQVADELRRLTEAHAQMTGSTSFHDSRGGATAPDTSWDTHGPYAPQRARRNRGRALSILWSITWRH